MEVRARPNDRGFADLDFTVNGAPRSQRIMLRASPCRYGGRRYYFLCGGTYERCEVLCCLDGVFASAHHHRLSHQSQSDDAVGRAREAHHKAEARLFGKDGYPRPRGANRERLLRQWESRSERFNAELASYALRRWGIGLGGGL